LANELIAPQTINEFYGPAGSYKTWFGLFMLGQLARGQMVGTMTSRPARGLLISQEMRFPKIRKRVLSLWSDKELEELADTVAYRFQMNLDFYSRTLQSQKLLEKAIKESNRPDFVLIDAYNNIHTGDENSNRDMSKVCGAQLEVYAELGVAGGFLHHKGKSGDFTRADIDTSRGATVIRDICADMFMISPLSPKGGRARSRFKPVKTRDLSDPALARPFGFMIEPHPDAPGRVIFTFDEKAVEDSPATHANCEVLRGLVEELAGDGEVMKDALVDSLVRAGWGRRRIDETIQVAVMSGRVGRKKEGREMAFFIPRGIDSENVG